MIWFVIVLQEFRRRVVAIERRHRHEHLVPINGEHGGGGVFNNSVGNGHQVAGDIEALCAEYDQLHRRHGSAATSSAGHGRHSGGVHGSASPHSGSNGHSSSSSGNNDENSGSGTGSGGGMTESKIQYVRAMVLQYLSCREPEVKLHIESALVALFRLSAAERQTIEDRRREESQDSLSSITSFFGSLSVVSAS